MMSNLTLEEARNMTNEDLFCAMRDGFEISENGIRKTCVAIAVLEEREVALPMLPEVFRFSRQIAEGQLSARAGLILGRFPYAINAILSLPLPLQDELADGRKVKVAVKIDGRIRAKEMTIFEMSQFQMRLAFSDEGITPWERQGEWLIKSGFQEKVVPRTRPSIAVDRDNREIVINRTRVRLEELIPALSALGYSVKPIYGAKPIKPVKVR